MGGVETANTLALVGAILCMVFGTIYLLVGVALELIIGIFVGLPWIIYGSITLTFGTLILVIARKSLLSGDLKTGAILCFVFGGITSGAIGGILAIVAGILAIIAWNEQRRAVEAPPSPPPAPPSPPPAPPPTAATVIYCVNCGAKLSPEVIFCSSCGKKQK